MKIKKLFILGIDPGTTLGYALVDLDGNLIELKSVKGLSLDFLCSRLVKKGKVVVISVDVKNAPSFASKLSARLGARLIVPDGDLLIKDKLKLIKDFKVTNKHQRDALASALFAFKSIRSLLNKIDRHLKKRGKKELSDYVKEILLTKQGISVSMALDRIKN